ncbi:uncharacterized protein BJ212DRAFT_1446773 [Suillus subaureus]|uniref:DUF6830 domain-containing protein n=1 Tax=Suillus subaureus TaxID=48587 RepID=A0A9P7ECT6_9AGAM|nr:uncharacterized protein BJ212DRAFT_1446773 [Suillus subaureus]KAG1817263.1 hypothetical protein BJ212DRAFT_1446773 [Suillus subaureus]
MPKASSYCPSCGKKFKDHSSVTHHMSQPLSGCNMWLDDLIQLEQSSCSPEDHAMEVDNITEPYISDSYEPVGFMDSGDTFGEGESMERTPQDKIQDASSEVTDHFPNPPLAFKDGYTFLSLFDSDENSIYHKMNLYYPFSSQKEWQISSWLLRSGLSMGKIDAFLGLEMIKDLSLSFCSARDGPRWKSQVITTMHPMKLPVVLYWRDPLECILNIFNHPLFHDCMDYSTHRVYTCVQKACHIYTEWMTGDCALEIQSALPVGATFLSTILSSDKTTISSLTGDHIAHPLLISLANLHMNTCLKSSTHSFVLTVLLPVPKFIHKKKCMKGVLQDHLIHQCLNIILHPLKQAAEHGIMLSMTLAQLAVIHSHANPNDLEAYFREAQKFRLNGVNKPFWSDWIFADPSHFLTPKILHHIYKEFYDHDAQWLIVSIGESEIDFQFSVLQPITRFQHFHEGILKLKKVTGHCHCDIHVDAAPPGVLAAVHALMQFRYLVQSPHINKNDLKLISGALDEFHVKKDTIIAAGARQGQCNKVINNWHIPKLELMQNIVPSIHNSGITSQWTADITEHAHITEIKDPARSSNNVNYDLQIYHDQSLHSQVQDVDIDPQDNVDTDADKTIECPSTVHSSGYSCPITDYFSIARKLQHMDSVPLPLCSFIIEHAAFHLSYDPTIRKVTVDEIADKFGLPDLWSAIADYLQCEATFGHQYIHPIGGPRRAEHSAILPFDNLQVWIKIQLQDTEFHDPCSIRPAQTLNCAPPGSPWILGHYDTIIVQTEAGYSWLTSGLSGHAVAQLRLIMHPMAKRDTPSTWKDQFLTYVQCFNISGDCDLITQLHLLKRAKCSNGTCIGDVVPVSQLRAPVNLVPHFGTVADMRLTAYNSLEHALEFWLNHFWDKNTFFPLSA